jgi:hypothetical protein
VASTLDKHSRDLPPTGEDDQVKDWVAWHEVYDDPASPVSARLERVRSHLAEALGRSRPGPISLVSLCAGQGHDVFGVLPDHPRRDDVTAVLVENDPRNAQIARERAVQARLDKVEVREADAGQVASFADALPADVLLLCGIFGNVSDDDIRRTVQAAASLCSDGATVIWTRHRRPPDLTPQLRAWFAGSGFDELAFDSVDAEIVPGIGVHRLRSRPASAVRLPDGPLFTFVSR